MSRLILLAVTVTLLSPCHGVGEETAAATVQLEWSGFRLIREVQYKGRDLRELAIEAGMYSRDGSGYLPGAERRAAFSGGRTWHGISGIGLVAYNAHMGKYAIYYLQDKAVPGHHVDLVYADDDFLFFTHGFHKELPEVEPALEVYSVERDSFARVTAVTSRDGKFGYVDYRALAAKSPGSIGPSMGWNHRALAELEWVPLSENLLFFPQRVTLHDGVYTLWYHTDWDVDEFVTALRFAKADLDRELDRIASHKPPESVGGRMPDNESVRAEMPEE